MDNTTLHNVLVYPNPASHTVTVEADSIQSVNVYSVLGQELSCQKSSRGKRTTLDIEHLPDGFYILAIKTPQGMVYKKVTKTK
ncbi:MAG: T9SS type A sorting domain-containing protein [Bacteroidales bacterium]|nr:T9SS type A sorting domain-containing protein [Bacteroidales bacterium]